MRQSVVRVVPEWWAYLIFDLCSGVGDVLGSDSAARVLQLGQLRLELDVLKQKRIIPYRDGKLNPGCRNGGIQKMVNRRVAP